LQSCRWLRDGDIRTAYRGNDLRVLDEEGRHRQAAVFASAVSRRGPVRDCGYAVKSRATRIRLDTTVTNPFWWMAVGYLSSGSGEVEVRLDGKQAGVMKVQNGLHTYYLRGEGELTTIELRSATANLTVCVDTVRVGDLVPIS